MKNLFIFLLIALISAYSIKPTDKSKIWISAVLIPLISLVVYGLIMYLVKSSSFAGYETGMSIIPAIISGIIIYFQGKKKIENENIVKFPIVLVIFIGISLIGTIVQYTLETKNRKFIQEYSKNGAIAGQYNVKTGDIVFNPNITYGSITDIDGNTYKTVTIGTQTWMAENLKVTKYNDGIAIPNVTDNTAWMLLTTGALCDYDNTPSNSEIYGKLYNWHAVNTGKLCPTGWHVPSDAEWTELTYYLGGTIFAGGKLKETGTTHWASPNTGATNETGFTALPGGYRGDNGAFDSIGSSGYWWSATEDNAASAWSRPMFNNYSSVDRGFSLSKEVGFSVRCVRD